MTLVELKYLVALAQDLHFGKAAKRCNVSQPTLSVAISKAENKIGYDIFERNNNQICITEAGEKLIAQAKRILEEVDRLHDIANASKDQLDTPLKLGGIYTIAPYLFPTLIPALKKIAPNMPLIIEEDYTVNLSLKLQRGELDAIFIALPFEANNILVKPIYDEPFMVLLPKSHPLSEKSHIPRSALKKENTLFLGKGHCFRQHVLEQCPECHNTNATQEVIEGSSLETLRHMVASGLGITILPSTATQIKYYNSTLCAKPFKGKCPKRSVALAWRSSFPRTKAIDALLKALKKSNLSNTCPIN